MCESLLCLSFYDSSAYSHQCSANDSGVLSFKNVFSLRTHSFLVKYFAVVFPSFSLFTFSCWFDMNLVWDVYVFILKSGYDFSSSVKVVYILFKMVLVWKERFLDWVSVTSSLRGTRKIPTSLPLCYVPWRNFCNVFVQQNIFKTCRECKTGTWWLNFKQYLLQESLVLTQVWVTFIVKHNI